MLSVSKQQPNASHGFRATHSEFHLHLVALFASFYHGIPRVSSWIRNRKFAFIKCGDVCRQDKGFCLLNKPRVNMLASNKFKENTPSPNEQCRLSLGSNVEAAKMDEDNKVSTVKFQWMIEWLIGPFLDLVWLHVVSCGAWKISYISYALGWRNGMRPQQNLWEGKMQWKEAIRTNWWWLEWMADVIFMFHQNF